MSKLSTSNKPSRSIDPLPKLINWPFLLGIPVAVSVISTSLAYIIAPEPCRQSVICVQVHAAKSVEPMFRSVEALSSIPDDMKFLYLISYVSVWLFGITFVLRALYLLFGLTFGPRLESDQGDGG